MYYIAVPRRNPLPLQEEHSDEQVLAGFAATRSQAAFTLLVKRYGGMVQKVCWRVLQHRQDAEDAFQRTFSALIRNTASIRNRGSIKSWLYGTAFRAASEVRRERRRRQKHERQYDVEPIAPTEAEAQDPQLLALLVREVQLLPEKFRSCFVAHCLEGKSKSTTASELGLKEGTVASRAAKARKILQQRLARLGITPW